jgi:DNA-binding MarR family transcriptional regulator
MSLVPILLLGFGSMTSVRTSSCMALDRIVEVEKRRTRPDDERRRYYRITPFANSVARAVVRRLLQLVRHAQARGLTPRAV